MRRSCLRWAALGSEQGEIGGDEGPFLVGDVGGVARGHARSLLRARPEVHNTLYDEAKASGDAAIPFDEATREIERDRDAG